MSEDAKPDSPVLAAYLELERLRGLLQDGPGREVADSMLCSAMDGLWLSLSEAEREWLDERHE